MRVRFGMAVLALCALTATACGSSSSSSGSGGSSGSGSGAGVEDRAGSARDMGGSGSDLREEIRRLVIEELAAWAGDSRG